MHEQGSLGGFDELGLAGLENARCARILGFAIEKDLVRGCSPNRQKIPIPEQDLHFSEHFDFCLLSTTKTWMFRRSPTCLVEEEKSGAKSFGGNVLAPLIDKLI
jgi:hypothetical protein